MHRLSTSFILGYHGCSTATAKLLLKGDAFQASENDYDWLGHGVYFWEANPLRGLHFYQGAQKRKEHSGRDGTVVGAVIDLGFCLDLLSSTGIETVRTAYADLKAIADQASAPMPVNTHGGLLRNLDCAVINHLHESRKDARLDGFDTVRGMFDEGKPAFTGSGIAAKAHIQIAVRSLSCIKGVFRVPREHLAE
ncbi:MAG: hypothetical protein Q7T08_14375 [Devosia sp.]|nr:hypothetical protein [Devosia sp.]